MMSLSSNTGRGVIIDSLMSKIIQYEYNIIKLKRLAESLERLIKEASNSKDTAILHYIVPFIGNAFAISENGFNSRLQDLERYTAVNINGFSIPTNLFHIPYDNNDSVVLRPREMPSSKDVMKCVRQLRELCEICLRGYNSRMALAIKKYQGEKESVKALVMTVKSLLERDYLDYQSIDIALGCDFLTRWEEAEAHESEEATSLRMIEMDIRIIFTLVPKLKSVLHKFAGEVAALQKIKKIPTQKQEEYISSLPDHHFLLHRIVMLILRLNDLYLGIRKVGRKIYLSNYEHIRDHPFLCLQNNSQALRWSISEMNELFTLNKRNGALIAGLTRCFGQNVFIQDSKTLLSLTNFASQGVTNIASMLNGLEVFGQNWLLQEVDFRKTYRLREDSLVDLVVNVRNQSEILRHSRSNTAKKSGPLQSYYKPDVSRSVGAPIPAHGSEKAVPNESSLENSVTSLSLVDNSPGNVGSILERASETDEGSGNKAESSPTLTTPSDQASQLPTDRNVTASPIVEHKSTHQQSSENTSKADSLQDRRYGLPNASSAAAHSFSRNHYGLHSPGSLRSLPIHHRNSLLLRSTNEENFHIDSSSPHGRRIEKEMQIREAPERITANQRFQRRIKDASQSGSILTQNKPLHVSSAHESINPSDRYMRNFYNSEQASSRSLKIDLSDNSSMQKENLVTLSSTEDASGLIPKGQSIKRVRFTGVPEYTEAEDAPSRYHNKYLKSVAVVRTPNPTLRKKDQMFQNEESILFRSQIHNEGSNLSSNLSKLRQKLI